MNLFNWGNGGQEAAATSTAAPQAPQTPVPETAPDASGMAKGNPTPQGNPGITTNAPKSHLDAFHELVVKSQIPGDTGDSAKDAPIDIEALAGNTEAIDKIAEGLNLTQGMPPELANSLDESSRKALEYMAKEAYKAAFQHSALLAGRGVSSQSKSLPSIVDQHVTKALNNKELQAAVPSDAHPATKFVLSQVADGFARSGMAPAEAMAMARSVLSDVGANLSPPSHTSSPPPIDWDTWMTTGA